MIIYEIRALSSHSDSEVFYLSSRGAADKKFNKLKKDDTFHSLSMFKDGLSKKLTAKSLILAILNREGFIESSTLLKAWDRD